MTTVVIPWANDGSEERAWALAWVLDRWAAVHPSWAVCVARAPAEPWVKAAAVMPTIEAAPDGPVVVADADVWSDDVGAAVDGLSTAAWAVPHRWVRRLNAGATAAVYGGVAFDALDAYSLAERAYIGTPGGGIVVAPRDVLLSVPFDPRFEGWGGEDYALGCALLALYREPWQGTGNLWHLWHRPQLRPDRRYGSPATEALRARYRAALGDTAAMLTLVSEAREAATWPRQRSRFDTKASGSY